MNPMECHSRFDRGEDTQSAISHPGGRSRWVSFPAAGLATPDAPDKPEFSLSPVEEGGRFSVLGGRRNRSGSPTSPSARASLCPTNPTHHSEPFLILHPHRAISSRVYPLAGYKGREGMEVGRSSSYFSPSLLLPSPSSSLLPTLPCLTTTNTHPLTLDAVRSIVKVYVIVVRAVR